MNSQKQFCLIGLFFIGCLGFSQTEEQQKMIEKGKILQDSLLKTPMYKELMRINDQEEVKKKAKKANEDIIVKLKGSTVNSKPKLDNYPFSSLDVNVMVIPFGIEKPIKIGTMSKSGDIKFELPTELPKLSKDDKESESFKLWYTIFSQCSYGSEMVAENDNIFSFDTAGLSLWTSDNRYVGVIFAVSDELLITWVEDPVYMEPTMDSYFELVYVAKPFQYKGNCNTARMMDEGEEDVKIDYTYNLNLKAGFNFIEYKIESIHKTDPNIMAFFPDKVSITSVDGIPNCKWMAKYF